MAQFSEIFPKILLVAKWPNFFEVLYIFKNFLIYSKYYKKSGKVATNPQKPRQINVFAWPNPVLKVGRKWPNGQIWPNNCEFFVNFYLFGQIKVAKWPNPKNKSGHKIRPNRPQTAIFNHSKSVQTVSLSRFFYKF